MRNKSRKHIRPVSLVMSIAIIGALAAFLVLASNPGETQAHGPGDHPGTDFDVDCAEMTTAQRAIHNVIHEQLGRHGTMDPCPDEQGQNQAPIVDAPDMEPIVIEGIMVMVDDGSVANTATVPGVTSYFSDPDEGDELTFTPGSSNTEVATGMLDDDGNLVVTAVDVGEATITVTATDPAGETVTWSIMVSVRLSPAERYTIAPPTYEFDAPTTQEVTFTVSAVDADATPLDEDATVSLLLTQFPAAGSTSPLVTRVIGLDSSLDNDITDDNILQGLLTVRATDPDGKRGFTVYFECTAPGERVEIDMLDEEPQLVGEATISCKEPDELPPPEDDESRSDVMTVVSYNDWDHWKEFETVSDGFVHRRPRQQRQPHGQPVAQQNGRPRAR